MGLEQSLLTEFAKAVNGDKKEQSSSDKFIRGTAKTINGKKYVQLDGSNVTTPISETVDVEDGDRVLVSIENHKATILGNFTFPPSARKEQEAIDKAEDAQNGSNLASQKAEEAIDKATEADEKASSASAQAEESIKKSEEALTHADEANKNVTEAKDKANQAVQDAASAKDSAAKAQADVANANAEIEKINGEITSVQGDIDSALENLYSQAGEIESIKQTYSTKVETEKVKADLTTEIETKVGELKTTVEQTYAAKTDIVTMEGKLQTQITQNAKGLSSQASKIESLESDTAQAQEDVNKALQNAANAQATADKAQQNATAAQTAADKAKENADNAKKKSDDAEDLALKAAIDARVADEALTAAKTALDEAKKNYELIVNNPSSTQQQIQQAQAAVDTATANVNQALADAATAAYAADQAQKAADQAVIDANAAKDTANDAQNKANAAEILANNAQQAADKAQQEVAELTKRVVTAETNITQNAEAIALNASKTTEIGDKLKNDYYNKTEFEAQMKVEADKISSTISETVTNTVTDNLAGSPGGENLLPNEKKEVTTGEISNHELVVKDYNLTSIFDEKVNKDTGECPIYTVSFDVKANIPEGSKLPTGVYYVSVLGSDINGDNTLGGYKFNDISGDTDIDIEWVRYSVQIQPKLNGFVAGETFDFESVDPTYLCFKSTNLGNVENATFSIRRIQLNEGEEVKEWVDPVDGVFVTKSEHTSSIEQLADQISQIIVGEDGSSMMTQDENGWHFDMSSITGNIDAVKKELADAQADHAITEGLVTGIQSTVDEIDKKTAYIDIKTDSENRPVMTLGSSESSFKVVITNESIDFMNGSNRVAYASGNRFYAPQMVTTNSIQIGENPGFRWERRSNGNLGLVYVSQ